VKILQAAQRQMTVAGRFNARSKSKIKFRRVATVEVLEGVWVGYFDTNVNRRYVTKNAGASGSVG